MPHKGNSLYTDHFNKGVSDRELRKAYTVFLRRSMILARDSKMKWAKVCFMAVLVRYQEVLREIRRTQRVQ